MTPSTSVSTDTPPNFGEVAGIEELDTALYNLDDTETDFIIKQTGLSNSEEVRKHLIQIQHEVYAVSH